MDKGYTLEQIRELFIQETATGGSRYPMNNQRMER
jgi:hypothetical protein